MPDPGVGRTANSLLTGNFAKFPGPLAESRAESARKSKGFRILHGGDALQSREFWRPQEAGAGNFAFLSLLYTYLR
jgi:hypothetical protein